ncbi:hypothetical protein HII31_00315 [Pseudocercospora fuligena]|uniref:F-box domain-containing protein n=1 Tax=Pseudocercospora fuligena TaxID=685502 RepID=A0A8H6RYK6_9PEZI|nr:hypothetical protein HII31_00315 [Pseudocercospora fuligena]
MATARVLRRDGTNMAVDDAVAATQAADAHTNTHAARDSGTSNTPICYFLSKLPRELRDMVYSYLGADYTAVKPTKSCDSTIRLKNGPQLAVLLVNKQIKAEYWQMCEEMTEIVLVDVYEEDHGISTPKIPDTLVEAKTAHFLLLVVCFFCHTRRHDSLRCHVEADLENQGRWLREMLAEMPYVTDVSVKVHFPWPYTSYGEGGGYFTQWPQSPYNFDLAKTLRIFAEVPQLTKFTAVGHTGSDMANGSGGISADKRGTWDSHRYVSWTREEGWDDLSREQPQNGQVSRQDRAAVEGFEYRSGFTDSESEDEDESEEVHEDQDDE